MNTVTLVQIGDLVLFFSIGKVSDEDINDEPYVPFWVDNLVGLRLAQWLTNDFHTVVEQTPVEYARESSFMLFAPELGLCHRNFPLADGNVGNKHPCTATGMASDILVDISKGHVHAMYLNVARVVQKVRDITSEHNATHSSVWMLTTGSQ